MDDNFAEHGAFEAGEEPVAPDAAPHMENMLMSIAGFTYATIVGFDAEIARLREMGVIDQADSAYLAFVEQMKAQHGLYDEPLGRTVLFESAALEDADRLMLATANEIGRPTVVMRVVETAPGVQALCIMANAGLTSDNFKDMGTLVLQGIDQWGNPMDEAAAPYAEMTSSAQGAMRAIALIRSAVANPRVSVLASASCMPDPESLVMRILGPAERFEVPAPDAAERDAIWDHLMDKHVSLSSLDRYELVELSQGMPRCDIFCAAREAVAQAFHQSLSERRYIPVSRANVLDKVAAYQPLGSREYQRIEDCVVEDLRAEIERYERGEL